MASIGVLALQGGYEAHARCLEALGLHPRLVKSADELDGCVGLVLPGGESTTHLKLIHRFGLWAPLQQFAERGHPIMATCAGLILAARQVVGHTQDALGWLDIDVKRNAWGRQVHSFEATLTDPDAPAGLRSPPFNLLFIRAPKIVRCGPEVEVVARFNGEPIAVRQNNVLGISFHPELKMDGRFHALVFGTIEKSN